MGFYAKKKFQTAPVQAVTEPSLESNSNVNVPTIEAVNKGLAVKRLLINNDFQINKRGQLVYDFSNLNGYTLDMWKINKLKLSILDDGWIKIENGDTSNHSLRQIFETVKRGKFVYALNVRNVSEGSNLCFTDSQGNYTRLGLLQEGINIFKFETNEMYDVQISCVAGGSYEIEYIDLFEGDIAYPHIKEDYDVALMRCQNKVLYYPVARPLITILSWNKIDKDSMYVILPLPTTISNNAVVSCGEIKVNATRSNNEYVDVSIRMYEIRNGILTIALQKNSGTFNVENDKEYYGIINELLISCEPL